MCNDNIRGKLVSLMLTTEVMLRLYVKLKWMMVIKSIRIDIKSCISCGHMFTSLNKYE
jgi:hypothetical protein